MLGLFVGVVLMSQSVVAKGGADESNTIAIEACRQKEYDVADKKLNTGYNEATETLEPAAKQKLKDAQKAWLKSRDANIVFMIKQNKDSEHTAVSLYLITKLE